METVTELRNVTKLLLAKLLYGSAFVVLLPALLVIWAKRTAGFIALPAVHSWSWGMLVSAVGVSLMLLGMQELWLQGGGLPMNAFPPTRYVSSGVYRVVSHPIYAGFAALCVGVAIASGSASGLWLICPSVILGSAALVLGYELPDMRARFAGAFPQDRLLPPNVLNRPTLLERTRCYLSVVFPWILLYEAVVALGVSAHARAAYFPFELKWPVWQWTEVFYGSVYIVAALVPILTRTRHDLRWFSVHGLVSMLLVLPLYLAVPLVAPPRPMHAHGILGAMLQFDRAHDSAAAAFPSYHVIWAFLAAAAIWPRGWQRRVGQVWAVLVSASCITTGMHAVVDVLAGLLIVWIVTRIEDVWSFLRSASEKIANSWREWRFGPVRVIVHGAYAAAGVFLGILILDTLLGPGRASIPISIFVAGSIGAALWAQWIEGSPVLLRPLGFYGGMIGTSVGGICAAYLSGVNLWVVLGALCVAAPWIQGLGRLRCLVQGCCHGRRAIEMVGIRYLHPRSRVYRIEELRGLPVHATPLYSLLWNVMVALLVTRLYLAHTTVTMVGGVYLILTGLGRFVEESYRGEPQTRIVAGLRLYQWIAIASVLIGAVITTIAAPGAPNPEPHASSLLIASGCALFAWFLTAVDFPESNRRFARLT